MALALACFSCVSGSVKVLMGCVLFGKLSYEFEPHIVRRPPHNDPGNIAGPEAPGRSSRRVIPVYPILAMGIILNSYTAPESLECSGWNISKSQISVA